MRKLLKVLALGLSGMVVLLMVALTVVVTVNSGLFDHQRETPKTMRVKADFQSIGSALRTYKINAGHYPTTEQGLQALVERPTIPPLPEDWVQIFDKMQSDPWRRDYQYRLVGEAPHVRFELRSLGLDGIEGTKDDQSSLDH